MHRGMLIARLPPAVRAVQGLDIGPDSLKAFQAALADVKTVVWNGPMGVFEMEKFAAGTFGVAETLAGLKVLLLRFTRMHSIRSSCLHLCSPACAASMARRGRAYIVPAMDANSPPPRHATTRHRCPPSAEHLLQGPSQLLVAAV